MNCSTCQNQITDYLSGIIPADKRPQLEEHLNSCPACRQDYQSQAIIEQVIKKERSLQVNPFLSTRVMTALENQAIKKSVFEWKTIAMSALQPMLITALLVVGITIGIRLGNTYNDQVYASRDFPQELLYMNDAAMESINILIQE